MAKGGGKSSASSATRKKHARKAAGPPQPQDPPPKDKKAKKDKGKNKEPHVKRYIPPVKPPPVQVDPLDSLGLASVLPPDLLVVLRGLGKKDGNTKRRALEELQGAWVDKCRRGGDDESPLMDTLIVMLPVWMHHLPALFLHPSRKLRLLAAGLHISLVHIHPIRDAMLLFLRETASQDQLESILGAWCLASHDVERPVAIEASKSWADAFSHPLAQKATLTLLAFIQRTLMDPLGVYLYLNPVPVDVPLSPMHPKGTHRSPALIRRDTPEPSTRAKVEGDEEDEQDRKARLRIGAFGAIKWILDTPEMVPELSEAFLSLFSDPALWSSLHLAEFAPFAPTSPSTEGFGHRQPNVRKAAWGVVQALLSKHKGIVEALLPLVSTAVLRSAWVELDLGVRGVLWQPLLTFLKEYPQSWALEAESSSAHDGADSDGSDDDETAPTPPPVRSQAYIEFLTFLSLACSGAPIQGYPTLVIIITTIPETILPREGEALKEFFAAFWGAIESRALNSLEREREKAGRAFLEALVECVGVLVRHMRTEDDAHAREIAKNVVGEQLERMWDELVSGRLRVEGGAAGSVVGTFLGRLEGVGEAEILRAAWFTLTSSIKPYLSPEQHTPPLVVSFLKALDGRFKDKPDGLSKESAGSLIGMLVVSSLSRCEKAFSASNEEASGDALQRVDVEGSVATLTLVMDNFDQYVYGDVGFANRIDSLVSMHASTLLALSPSLLLSYLAKRKSKSLCTHLWNALLSGAVGHPDTVHMALKPLVDAAKGGLVPGFVKAGVEEGRGLDAVIGWVAQNAMGGGGEGRVEFVKGVLLSHEYFLSGDGFRALRTAILSTFTNQVSLALRDSTILLSSFNPALDLIEAQAEDLDFAQLVSIDVFVLGYLVPRCVVLVGTERTIGRAQEIWIRALGRVGEGVKGEIDRALKMRLRELVLGTDTLLTPDDVYNVFCGRSAGSRAVFLRDVLPSCAELDKMLEDLPSDPVHPSLAIFDPLLPLKSAKASLPKDVSFDKRGFSSYARVCDVLSLICMEETQLDKANLWILRHILALYIYASDFAILPALPSPVFDKSVSKASLEYLSKGISLVTALLVRPASKTWHADLVSAILEDASSPALDPLGLFVLDLIARCRRNDGTRECRVLKIVLFHAFGVRSRAEADLWVRLARDVEKTAPQTSMAIISVVAEFGPEPPLLDKYRNKLAADLVGFPARKANTEGLLLLRKLAATAPDPTSEVAFLPPPRAVNVMKAFLDWFSSDEDIEPEVQSMMTLICNQLAPILQGVPGEHWGLIFDLVEDNLETSLEMDDLTLVTLARTLNLIISIQNLASTNHSLHADWSERSNRILKLVCDFAAVSVDSDDVPIPRSKCRELSLEILRSIPSASIDQDTLGKMCHLLDDPSADVQILAYQFLKEAAKKRTEHFVIEAGVDADASVKAELPLELMDILRRTPPLGDEYEADDEGFFSILLGWMIAFDLFVDASMRVRSNYIDQLRNPDVIQTHLVPTLFHILGLYDGWLKSFKLDVWAVDEYYIQFHERASPVSAQLLAAHIYYRALLTVPSIIRAWLDGCRDIQLSSAVVAYTSRYFSPVIIKTELARVRSQEAIAQLTDENMVVKVSNNINEVTAVYSVDEHQLSITLKLPSDWPLHVIKITDDRVAVPESHWRAWVLGVQQIIWSQNGRIVDGLTLFKRNISLHFQGQVECAICYSIISPLDDSFPRKPCKTCNNRFHASCLYKWFSSSHSMSCPLCRSDMV